MHRTVSHLLVMVIVLSQCVSPPAISRRGKDRTGCRLSNAQPNRDLGQVSFLDCRMRVI